jgi:hypothetical protein
MNMRDAKIPFLLCLLFSHGAVLCANGKDGSDTLELRIARTGGNGSVLTLVWAGGRPTYQLQRRSSLDQSWLNVGEPTTATSADVSLEGNQAFFRVLSDYTARYEVLFDSTWSGTTHPQDWPNPGHWSGLVGAVHNSNISFFREGETASEGIRLMAERGQQDPLLSEVMPAIQAGTAQFQLRGGGINPSPGAIRLTFPEPMRRDYPLVTLVSMVAPSPDWFAGVAGLNLIENGAWAKQVTVELYPYDAGTDSAGTDSGVTFRSADEVTSPRGVITRLTIPPIALDGTVVPFGTFTFTRLD